MVASTHKTVQCTLSSLFSGLTQPFAILQTTNMAWYLEWGYILSRFIRDCTSALTFLFPTSFSSNASERSCRFPWLWGQEKRWAGYHGWLVRGTVPHSQACHITVPRRRMNDLGMGLYRHPAKGPPETLHYTVLTCIAKDLCIESIWLRFNQSQMSCRPENK